MDWQVSHLTRALCQISALSPNIIGLTITPGFDQDSRFPEGIDNLEWLQLLSLFSSVQTLFVRKEFARHVSRAPEDIADRMIAIDVLPALDVLWLEEQSVSSVNKFIAARRNSGRPVTIVNMQAELVERRLSFQ